VTALAMIVLEPRIQPTTARGSDGFIVVAVLWILGALATLASIYAVYVINTATSMSVNKDRLQAEALVTAALELTAYRVTAVGTDNRPSRGEFLFRLGNANVTVEFKSETGRIDLNMAPKELLVGLFAGFGAKYSDAEFYADRIIAWRAPSDPDKPNDEASAYRAAGLTYSPRQAPFAHVGELALVLGLPPFLVERAMPFVTVFSGRPEINIFAAPPEVLAAIPGMTPDRLYALLSRRGVKASSGPTPPASWLIRARRSGSRCVSTLTTAGRRAGKRPYYCSTMGTRHFACCPGAMTSTVEEQAPSSASARCLKCRLLARLGRFEMSAQWPLLGVKQTFSE
jgi:general secretion pathway protein K